VHGKTCKYLQEHDQMDVCSVTEMKKNAEFTGIIYTGVSQLGDYKWKIEMVWT